MARQIWFSKGDLKKGVVSTINKYNKVAKTNKFNVFIYINMALYFIAWVLFILNIFSLTG